MRLSFYTGLALALLAADQIPRGTNGIVIEPAFYQYELVQQIVDDGDFFEAAQTGADLIINAPDDN